GEELRVILAVRTAQVVRQSECTTVRGDGIVHAINIAKSGYGAQLDCACAESDEREARSITKSPEPLAVGAHEEDALLRRLDRSISKRSRTWVPGPPPADPPRVLQDPHTAAPRTPKRPPPPPRGGGSPTSPWRAR